jgi:hypothetical protein
MRLHRAGIHTLRDAKTMTDAQLKTLPGLTDSGVAELRKALDRLANGDKISAA